MDTGAWDGGRTRTPAMNEAADFKSAVYTNFTTQAKHLLSPKNPRFCTNLKSSWRSSKNIFNQLRAQACIRVTAWNSERKLASSMLRVINTRREPVSVLGQRSSGRGG